MFHEIGTQRPFDAILDQIIENIKEGVLKPGDTLPAERLMAEYLGVSRPALREALRALEFLGVIVSVRGGANYIADDLSTCLIRPLSVLFSLNNSSVRDTQQLRSALEQKAAFLAAKHCTDDDASKLRDILDLLDHSDDEIIRAKLDKDLHMTIAKIAGNPMIYTVLYASANLIEQMITGIRAFIMQKNISVPEVDEQHHKIVQSIIRHEAEDARKWMWHHMNTIENFVLEKMDV